MKTGSRAHAPDTLVKTFCYGIVALILAIPGAWGQTLDKGLPANGSSIALKPTKGGYEARVIVAADAGFINFKVASSDPVLAAALGSNFHKTEGDKVKLVTISVKHGALPQGPYPLTLIGIGKDGALEREVILTVPAITLDPPETLVVVRERWYRGDTTSNSPQLWEASRLGWVTGITLTQKGDTEAGGEPTGHIKAVNKLADIAPGQNARIELGKHFQLEGDFPLGTTKGKLFVHADQLVAPVPFAFEIRSRIPRPWLFLPLVVGLVFGWLTRNWLQRRLAVAEEKQKPFALIDTIDAAFERNKDADFQIDAKAARVEAVTAASKEKVEDIRMGTTSAQAAFQKAIDGLHTRRAALDQSIAKMLALVRAGWRAPVRLKEVLASTEKALQTGSPALAANDVARASLDLEAARQALGQEVYGAISMLLDAAEKLATVIDAATPMLGEPSATDLKGAAKGLAAPLIEARNVLDGDPNSSAETLQASIAKVHAAVAQLGHTVANVRFAFDRQLAKLETTFAPGKLPNPTVWQGCLAQARSLSSELGKVEAAPERGLEGLEVQALALLKSFQDALLKQVAAKDMPEAETLLQAGKYAEIIEKIRQHIAAPNAGPIERGAALRIASIAGAGPDSRTSVASSNTSLMFSSVETPSLSFGFSAPPQSTTGIAMLAGQTRRTVEVTSGLLSLIYGFLIAAAGYFLFADKWIGVPLDWATVFFWAYATDVGAEAATTAARSLKKT